MKDVINLEKLRTKVEIVEISGLAAGITGTREYLFPNTETLRNKLVKRIWWNDDNWLNAVGADVQKYTFSAFKDFTAEFGMYLVLRNRKGEATQKYILADLRRQTLRFSTPFGERAVKEPAISFVDDMRINQILDVPKCSVKTSPNTIAVPATDYAIQLFVEYYILPDGFEIDGEKLKM